MSNAALLERLQAIANNASVLLDDKHLLEAQLNKLSTELNQLKKIVDVQKNSIEILEQKNKLTNIASVVSSLSKDEKADIKKSISYQIKEIDKCLNY